MNRIGRVFTPASTLFFRVDLSGLSELKIRELEAGNDIYMTGSNLRVLAISVDRADKENVEYVPVKAKAGYRNGYADPNFIASLPKFSLPTLPQSGTFRMFSTIGDAMLPIPEGADVICEFVEDWTSIKPGTLCVLVLKGEQDFVFKKVTIKPSAKAAFLESLNHDYLPYEVEIRDIVEIWKFQCYVSKDIPERLSDIQHLSITMSSVLQRLKVIQDKIYA